MQTVDKTYIVFQAYGSEDIINECLFALLTLSSVYTQQTLPNIEICIYTDKEAKFELLKASSLPLTFRKIDSSLIKEWRGNINFVHRVKIKVLQDFTQHHSGNILYLDTDVCFLKPIEEILKGIQDGHKYMHVMEGLVREESNPIFKKLQRFLSAHPSLSINGNTLNVPADATMWNAGLLGFQSAHTDLQQVLDFTDTVYPLFPKHIVEQFAFSLNFQKGNRIKAGAPYFLHYWNVKELRMILHSFFNYFSNATWGELVHYSQLIQPHVYLQQKSNFYESRSVMKKLQKQKWQPQLPDWGLLSQQL